MVITVVKNHLKVAGTPNAREGAQNHDDQDDDKGYAGWVRPGQHKAVVETLDSCQIQRWFGSEQPLRVSQLVWLVEDWYEQPPWNTRRKKLKNQNHAT